VSGSETSGRKIRLVGIHNREGIGGMTGRAAPEKGDEGPGRDGGGGQGGREKGTRPIKERHWERGKEARKEAGTKRKVERGRQELRTNGPHTDPRTGPVFAVCHTLSDL